MTGSGPEGAFYVFIPIPPKLHQVPFEIFCTLKLLGFSPPGRGVLIHSISRGGLLFPFTFTFCFNTTLSGYHCLTYFVWVYLTTFCGARMCKSKFVLMFELSAEMLN
uniref:Uncharacterized protein n=1 Tax=Trypanosoma vivax (strain Y486) TaxID=1055687 RepID=G0UAM6_TRYVY|nr:hypothetical protein TVY486_1103450 [Trypanosoma vivax Y486]